VTRQGNQTNRIASQASLAVLFMRKEDKSSFSFPAFPLDIRTDEEVTKK
jgi:hypothetical protein